MNDTYPSPDGMSCTAANSTATDVYTRADDFAVTTEAEYHDLCFYAHTAAEPLTFIDRSGARWLCWTDEFGDLYAAKGDWRPRGEWRHVGGRNVDDTCSDERWLPRHTFLEFLAPARTLALLHLAEQ